jgi:hypothetical protein
VDISLLLKKKSARIARIKTDKDKPYFTKNAMIFQKESNAPLYLIGGTALLIVLGGVMKPVRERVSELVMNPDKRALVENVAHFLAPRYIDIEEKK